VPDLRRSQSDAGRSLERIEHVLQNVSETRLAQRDRLREAFQRRVRVEQDRMNGHYRDTTIVRAVKAARRPEQA
jgi:hypothetical protein